VFLETKFLISVMAEISTTGLAQLNFIGPNSFLQNFGKFLKTHLAANFNRFLR